MCKFNMFDFRVFLFLNRLTYQFNFPYYLPIAGLRIFSKSVSSIRKCIPSHSGFELSSPNPYQTMVIITARTPP